MKLRNCLSLVIAFVLLTIGAAFADETVADINDTGKAYVNDYEIYSGGFVVDSVKRSSEYTDVGVVLYTGMQAEYIWVQDDIGEFGGMFNKEVTKCTEVDGMLKWEFHLTFLPGYHVRYFFGVSGDFYYSNSYVRDTIDIAKQNVDTYSASFASDSYAKNTAATAVVYTGPDAKYLKMYTDSGSLVKTWTASSSNTTKATLPDGNIGLKWTVKHTFTGTGSRTMKFISSNDNYTGDEVSAKVLITSGTNYAINSAKFDSTLYVKGKSAKITVKTGPDAKYLRMYAEDGSLIKTWTASSNSSLSGTVRVWKVSQTFSGAGARTMKFKASRDNSTYSAAKSANVLITTGSEYSVASAAFSGDAVKKNSSVTITVKTGGDAKYLRMYSESGSAVKTWSASGNSKISGKYRVWTVSYSFAGTGSRTMKFKASKNNSTYSAAKSAKILVTSGSDYGVKSAAFALDSVKKGKAVSITVKTGGDAKYLKMYSETGSLVKTWNAADHSKISGTTRVWTVSQTFSGAGDRTMTFKASPNNSTLSAGKTASIRVTTGADINAFSASSNVSSVSKGTAFTFTVKTGTDAKYLTMVTETGSKAKTWDAASYSTVSSGMRVWTVKHTFSGAGERTLTFKGSVDGSKYGTGKSVSLTVTSGTDYAVTYASFAKSSVVKGNAVSITVKTGVDAKYLTMFSEDGIAVKTWAASTSSTISGTTRVWKLTFSFSDAGNRSLTFKATKNGTTYGAGKTAKITVTSK